MRTTEGKPAVAVITRTKDRNLLLQRALQSVDSQTFSDYEHIIINDGGDKGKVDALLTQYHNKRRRVIHNSQSRGLVRALNQGVSAAKAKYIAILDDDDTWHKDRLDKTISFLQEENMPAVAVRMDLVVERIEGNDIVQLSKTLHPESADGQISLFKQCHKNYLSNGVITYTKKIYEELGGYNEEFETAEDWDFGIRLLLKSDVPLLAKEGSLCTYHQRPDAKEGEGNSGLAQVSTQARAIAKIRNSYLRSELSKGKLGVGYVMNNLEYLNELTVRLEGHVNRSSEAQQKDIHADIKNLKNNSVSYLLVSKLKKLFR